MPSVEKPPPPQKVFAWQRWLHSGPTPETADTNAPCVHAMSDKVERDGHTCFCPICDKFWIEHS
jgi:hypothetical protein